MEASGKETRGAGTASASVRSQLTGEGDTTHVNVRTNLNVTGRPDQFGRGVMAEVGGKLIGIFADNLASMLTADSGGDAADGAEAADAEDDQDTGVPADAAAHPDEALPIDVLNLPTRAWSSLRQDGVQDPRRSGAAHARTVARDREYRSGLDPEISKRLADRGLALAEPAGADGDSAVPSAPPAGDDAATRTAPSYRDAAERASANGGAPADTVPRRASRCAGSRRTRPST